MGYGVPFDFEYVNEYNGIRSVAGKVERDVNTAYYMRSLYQRAISGTHFSLPDSWRKAQRYFKNVLFQAGYIAVIDTPKFGIIPQICGFSGYGLYLEPKNVLVHQPLVQFEGEIGKNCEVIHLTGDYRGIFDIIEHYAARLSTAVTSLDVSLLNERLSLLAIPRDKAAAQTLKFLYEKISAGEPFSAIEKPLKSAGLGEDDTDPIWTAVLEPAKNYITDKLLADMETILRQFDAEIGIAAVGEKKERRVVDEVDIIKEDSCARCRTWREALEDSFDRANELFPELNLSFTMQYGGEIHRYGESE